jgi:large subunit ribosomal protein L10
MVEKKYKDKPALVAQLHDDLLRASAIVVTEYRGLKAGDLVKLRRGLRAGQIEVRVVKNTLLRRAADGTALAGLVDDLAGPSAIALGFGEPTEAAKLLAKSATDMDAFNLKHGIIESMVVSGEQIAAIAKLPGKQELQARAVGALQGPLASLVFTLQGVLTQFAGTLQAKIEKEGGAA